MLLTRRSLMAAAGASLLFGCEKSSKQSLVFADVSRMWWDANPIIALEQSRFADQPYNLSVFQVATGRESLDAVIAGNADLGMAAGIPLLFAAEARKTGNIQVLASISRADGLIGIVNHGPLNGQLPKEPIGLVPNTVAQYMLQLYARKIGRPLSASTKIVQLKPADLTIQYANGTINSFVFPEPYPSLAHEQAPQERKPTIIHPTGLYQMDFFIFTNKQALAAKASAINGFLSVLRQTSEWARAHPREAIEVVSQATGTPSRLFAHLWPRADLRVTGSRPYLRKALVQEASVAHSVGLTDQLVSMASLVPA